MYKYYLGLKYLLGRPINLLGTIGVMVAVWALVVVVSVFSGFITEVRAHIRGASPALTLLDDSLETSYAAVEEVLQRDPAVAAVAPRIVWHALLYPEKSRQRGQYLRIGERDLRGTHYFQVVGIDFAREARVSPILTWLENITARERRANLEGSPFAVDPKRLSRRQRGEFGQVPPGMLIGLQRASGGGLDVPTIIGDEIVLASAQPLEDGSVKSVKKDFVMAGSYEAGRYHELEDTVAFVDIEEVRSIFGHDVQDPDSLDVFTEVSIALADESELDLVAARLNTSLRDSGLPGAVVTWEERNTRFLDAVEHERGVMKVVLFVLMVVASFLIFATLSMMVTKKTRDIGILSALGATRRGVLMIFLMSGTVIALLGTGLGLLTGWLSCVYLNPFNDWLVENAGVGLFPKEIYGLPRIPYELQPAWFAQVALGAIFFALLFSFLPALRAARFDPVQALRYE